LFHADRRTDMSKLIVAFHKFAKTSTGSKVCHTTGNTVLIVK
jgi:hypothetical protein